MARRLRSRAPAERPALPLRSSLLGSLLLGGALGIPVPNQRQLDFMELEFITFFHYSIPTYWNPPIEYLYTPNPTYHNCATTTIDHGNQTGSYYPCLDPRIFAPTDLNADDWMRHAAALGSREICLTAHHEGGFALWPSNYTPYSVKLATGWRGGAGDVLREFADAANRWGIKICYYQNVQCNHYLSEVANVTAEQFIEAEIGMLHETLTQYGPVNRFWFDGTTGYPPSLNLTDLWARVYEEIRTTSPSTIISSYRGDVCATTGSLYTRAGPAPNSSDASGCAPPSEGGEFFQPSEMHGITIQEGPDGNTNAVPTYWFWHDWACAGNVSGCPWVGHANASRIFDSYLVTVGHGAVLNMNCPAERTGRMNASVAAVMAEAGLALNATFKAAPVAGFLAGPQNTTVGGEPIVIELPGGGGQPFDYVVAMEDLRFGQRVANYTWEFQAVGGAEWLTLVPPVVRNASRVGDRPDGHDPRDQYLGHKRIDVPVVNTSSAMSAGGAVVRVARVRFRVLRALAEPVFLRSATLRLKQAPWCARGSSCEWGAAARRAADEAARGLHDALPPRAAEESEEDRLGAGGGTV